MTRLGFGCRKRPSSLTGCDMPTRQIRKDIGYTTQTTRCKFALGLDADEARRREQRIKDLWTTAEARWRELNREDKRRFIWGDQPGLMTWARRLANGETTFALDPPSGPNYQVNLNSASLSFPTLTFVAADPDRLAAEKREFTDIALAAHIEEAKRRGYIPQNQANLIQANGTLHQQIDRRIEAIERDYFDPTQGHISDWGKGKQKTLRRVKALIADIELSKLDIAALDGIIGTFRNRPISKRTGKPLDADTCSDTITEFKEFLKWLDTLSGTGWELPAKFAFVSTRVHEIESEQEEAEPETFTIEQLATLNRFATPIERVFLYLGLNCAYGADQSGRLRIREVNLDADPPHIKRTRKKSGVTGRHLLWKPTQEAIRWAMKRHAAPQPEDFLLLNKSGQPYWRKTAGGNRAGDVPKLWRDLLTRVQKDEPDFPRHPFNSLRNTSADLVRQMAGEEMAQLQLTHKHQSPDRNMRRYTKKRVVKLFRVLSRLETKLEPVFSAASTPWVQPPKQYKPRKVDDQLMELHRQGLSPYKIAAKLGVSHMTVRRRLARQLPH